MALTEMCVLVIWTHYLLDRHTYICTCMFIIKPLITHSILLLSLNAHLYSLVVFLMLT